VNRVLLLSLANLILVVHLALVLVILFGWYFPSIYWLYIGSLAATLLSEAVLGYCILTKWEFDVRKKLEPNLDYDYAFLSYYFYKYIGINIPRRYIKYPAIVFLVVSLVVALVARYL
jgi:hypothetical protein